MNENKLRFGLLLLFALTGGAAGAQTLMWSNYANVRYAFSGCYPGNLFSGQGESDDGDGQAFSAADGAKILMYGAYVMPDPPDDNLHDELALDEASELGASGKAVLQRLKPDYFAFSGYSGNQIVYEKTLLSDDKFITFLFTYPTARRALYDPLIAPMLRCFKTLPGSP
jgi:hypothetical protein